MALEPDKRERPDQFQGVELTTHIRGQILRLQIEPGPQQLRPHLIGNDARVGAREGANTAGRGQGTGGIEAARDPLPLLAVMEEGTDGHNIARLGPGRQGPSQATGEGCLALHILADAHALHLRDVGGNKREE